MIVFIGLTVLNVSVSASHVIRSSDCGNFSVVYSSSDPINLNLPSPPSCISTGKPFTFKRVDVPTAKKSGDDVEV